VAACFCVAIGLRGIRVGVKQMRFFYIYRSRVRVHIENLFCSIIRCFEAVSK
jgi:hypothetical protein